MQKRIVYVLGAGFSAGLGAPLLADFFRKAVDVSLRDGDASKAVEQTLRDLHNRAKAIANVPYDSRNLEEVLSHLQMCAAFETSLNLLQYQQFVATVIEASIEPAPMDPSPRPQPRYVFPFLEGGRHEYWSNMFAWLAGLGGVTVIGKMPGSVEFFNNPERQIQYSIISLNYDLALEHTLAMFVGPCMLLPDTNEQLVSTIKDRSPGWPVAARPLAEDLLGVPIFKLHGCCSDPGSIVMPTWSKSLNRASGGVGSPWDGAYAALKEANEIRFLGFSFPQSDSYFRYFLMSSLAENSRLRDIRVHVMGDEEAEQRFKSRFGLRPTCYPEPVLQRLAGQAVAKHEAEIPTDLFAQQTIERFY